MPNVASSIRDDARLRPLREVTGVEVLDATFLKQRFSAHVHDSWCVSVVLTGAKDSEAFGMPHPVKAGEVYVLPPRRVHAGRVVGAEPCHYAMIYIPQAVMDQRASRLIGRTPSFRHAAFQDAYLVHRVAQIVDGALNGSSHRSNDVARTLAALLDRLVSRYGLSGPEDETSACAHAIRVDRARALLHDNWNKPFALLELADAVDLSPHHLCRLFSAAFGLPPHRYQLVLRLSRAKAMIAAGETLADVAIQTGFVDQSHLGRRFRDCFGVTPGSLSASFREGKGTRARTY